jgi:hypothetical protein
MAEAAEPATEEPECEIPERLFENDAVARCISAWRLIMGNERAELDEDEDESEAKEEANSAYLRAMPPLSGYQNICDFIACVTHGSMGGVIRQKDAEHFLAAAKIALCALRFDPKPAASAPRRPGRPRKNPTTEKNK